mmetsp:Transcript_22180/g.48198  ORF Transcript_22180/g.48198 Transcript_22180/m.48198 type:complete len:305 (+) Transcript_22180:506-1420(+)
MFTLSQPRLRRLAKHIEHEMKLGLVGDALSSLAMDVSWVTDHCVASAAVALSRPAQHTLSISASVDRAGITIAWNREGAAGSVANVKKLSCSADWVAASSAKQAVAAIVTALVDGFRAHHLSVEQSYSLSVAWGIPLPSTDLVWSRDIAVPVDASVTPADTRLHLRPDLTCRLSSNRSLCNRPITQSTTRLSVGPDARSRLGLRLARRFTSPAARQLSLWSVCSAHCRPSLTLVAHLTPLSSPIPQSQRVSLWSWTLCRTRTHSLAYNASAQQQAMEQTAAAIHQANAQPHAPPAMSTTRTTSV